MKMSALPYVTLYMFTENGVITLRCLLFVLSEFTYDNFLELNRKNTLNFTSDSIKASR